MPRDSAAADRPASYLVGTAAAFPLFFRDRTKPINQLPFSPSAKFPKSGSSCESRVKDRRWLAVDRFADHETAAIVRVSQTTSGIHSAGLRAHRGKEGIVEFSLTGQHRRSRSRCG